jgi:non-reducing end alpha-L-arabinofuranosidase
MGRKWFTAKDRGFRTLKAATFGALAGGAIWLSGPGAAYAAVLSVGSASNPFNGGYVCADVSGGGISSGNKVQAWDCHAGPNQQYEFLDETIYTLGGQRCLDVFAGGTAAGSKVDSAICNGTAAQKWFYEFGQIYNPNSEKCLDATNMANGTQLVINPCDGSASQYWQIK